MRVTQNTFSSGLIDRKLENRIDSGLPQSGFVDSINMIVDQYGTLLRRPGTKYFSTVGIINSGLQLRIRSATHQKTAATADNPQINEYLPIFDLVGTAYAKGDSSSPPAVTWTINPTTFLPTGDDCIVAYPDVTSAPYVTSRKSYIGHPGEASLTRTFLSGNDTGVGVDVDVSMTWVPDASCFFQDRYWVMIGNTLYGSAIGVYTDFTRALLINDETKSVRYTLSRFANKLCKWMIASGGGNGNADVLIIGYDTCEVIMTPPTQFHATATTPAGTPQFTVVSTTGSTTNKVCTVPQGFVHECNNKLYMKTQQSLYAGWTKESLNDFFDFAGIRDFCVQTQPFVIIWLVDGGGDLWSLTLHEGMKVRGWGHHNFLNPDGSPRMLLQSICLTPPLDSTPVFDKAAATPTLFSAYDAPKKQILYMLFQHIRANTPTTHTIQWLDLSSTAVAISDLGTTASPLFGNLYLDCQGPVNTPAAIDTNVWNMGVGKDGMGNTYPINFGTPPNWTDPKPSSPGTYLPWTIGFPFASYVTLPRPVVQSQQGSTLGIKTYISEITVEIPKGAASVGPDPVGFQQVAFDIGYEVSGIQTANRFNGWAQDRPLSDAERQGLVIRQAKSNVYDRNIIIQAVDQWRLDINSVVTEVNQA